MEEKIFPFFPLLYKHGENGFTFMRIVPMRPLHSLALFAALFFTAPATQAITLTNRDATEQKLIVIEGDAQSEKTIKPGEKLELCGKSCVIRMPDGENYEFEGTEIVSLEEGLLFLDFPEEQNKAAQ